MYDIIKILVIYWYFHNICSFYKHSFFAYFILSDLQMHILFSHLLFPLTYCFLLKFLTTLLNVIISKYQNQYAFFIMHLKLICHF